MDNLEKTEEAIKNGQSRENRRGNQEWTIQRKPKEAIKNGQSRENRRGNQEWTIQRKPKRQSRMDNLEKIEEVIKNGQSSRFYLTFICCSECKNKINNNNWLKKPSKDSPLRMKK
jgi:hypothetical protein